VRALAALRRHTRVFVCRHAVDVSFGALRLIHPAMSPASALMPVEPLDGDLTDYRAKWLDGIARAPAQR
jgi:hypothetical protein